MQVFIHKGILQHIARYRRQAVDDIIEIWLDAGQLWDDRVVWMFIDHIDIWADEVVNLIVRAEQIGQIVRLGVCLEHDLSLHACHIIGPAHRRGCSDMYLRMMVLDEFVCSERGISAL